MKLYYEVYGCAVMQGEALRALSDLKARGHKIVGSPEEADVSLIFTCTVRNETEQRMLSRISELKRRSRKVVVAGCLASAQPGLLKLIHPDVALVSNSAIEKLVDVVEGRLRTALQGRRSDSWLSSGSPRGFTLIVPIADGCTNNCTFCITKRARPRLISQSPRSIIEYVLKGVKRGAKEIWLTAPDVAAYGKDRNTDLPTLIEKLLALLPEDVKVRVGMMSPDTFSEIADRLLDVMRDNRVFKFFHLPLQSASDKVLKLMGRKYTYEEYKQLIHKVRKVFVDPTVATDIMVGFPGEDEEDFEATLRALKELAFERVHLAAYTPRPLTLGARMKQVREDVKGKRVKLAMRVVEKVGERVHARYVGGKFLAFVDEYDEKHGTYVARLHNYVPVVLKGMFALGESIWVTIEGATFYDLRGSAWERRH